jgi:glutamate racemase
MTSAMGAAANLNAPIGVFDSGIGGLSILQALRAELPHEDFVYVADSGHAPYGERDDTHVIARSRAIMDYLRTRYGIKALVIACNTATAAAVHVLRREHSGFPVVGVEPALKPAVAVSRTARIGVMATRGTLGSAKFRDLQASLAGQAEFILTPCDGLADAIEQEARSADAGPTIALATRYIGNMGIFGTATGHIDALVLGCTHYPFAAVHLRRLVGPTVQFVETGAPVARHTHRLLRAAGLLRSQGREGDTGIDDTGEAPQGQVTLLATGQAQALQAAAGRWLGLHTPVQLVHGV